MEAHFTLLILCQVNTKFLGSSVNGPILIHSLNSLSTQSHPNPSAQLIRIKPLPLQIDLLHLVNAFVREGNDTGFAVCRFAEEVAGSFAHDEG